MASRQEPWTKLAHSKKQPGWVAYNPRTMRPQPLGDDTKHMKILSYNVNGEGDVKDFKNLIAGYDYSYWSCSVARLDYSGTGVISRVKPISVQYGIGTSEHDQEGRVITLEFDNFYLVNAYVPNSGRGLKRLLYRVDDWDPCFSEFVEDMDIHNPPVSSLSFEELIAQKLYP
ncbi:hypothetical protein ACQ4PT_008090 [Festuca glaucescens]